MADRVDRVRLLFVTQSASLALATLLAALTWSGAIRPWHILATTFAGALLLAFDNPARQSLVPELVPKDALQNALSLNAATFTGAALVGPAIAGALLDVVGAGWLFMANAVSFLAVIFALAAMRGVPSDGDAPAARKGPSRLRDAIFGGFTYAAASPWLIALLVLSAVGAIFARSYQQLLPVFADDVYRSGPGGYGALLAGGGAGALVGAIGVSSMKNIEYKGRVMIGAGLALSGSLALFAMARTLALGVALVVAIGIAATVFTTMIATVIQLRVPGQLRGRVIALYVSTLIGLPSLGALGIAAIAKYLGSAPRAIELGAVVFAAALALAAPAQLRRAPGQAVAK